MSIVKALNKGTILRGSHGEYIIDSVLGSGSFGITYKAKSKIKIEHVTHTVYYAIKEFFMPSICSRQDDGTVSVNEAQKSKYEQHRTAFIKEACMLFELPPHDGIVKVNEYFNAFNTTYYVMEYLDEPLSEKVKSSDGGRLSEKHALNIFTKIASSVSALHDNNRLHLDIKPANIMIKDGMPKLIDFGQSRAFDEYGRLINEDADSVCSDGYSPVEQYSEILRFVPTADVYALGATLFYMLTGETPVKAQEMDAAYIQSKLPQNISAETRQMLLGALAKTKEARYKTVKDMLSVIGVIVSNNDGSETRAIDDDLERSVKPLTPAKRNIKLPLFIVLAAVVVAAIVWMITQCGGSQATEPADTPVDTVAVKDSVQDVKAGETKSAENVKTEEAESEPKPAEVNVPKPQTDNHPAPIPAKPASSPNTSLDYASWTGKIVNGKPEGRGTMTFTRSCVIPGSSYSVNAGDVFVGTFYHGRMVNGKLNGNYIEVED